jgi:hypothetical protein
LLVVKPDGKAGHGHGGEKDQQREELSAVHLPVVSGQG